MTIATEKSTVILSLDQRQRLQKALKGAGVILTGHDDQVEACEVLHELGLIKPNPTNYGAGTRAYSVTLKGEFALRTALKNG